MVTIATEDAESRFGFLDFEHDPALAGVLASSLSPSRARLRQRAFLRAGALGARLLPALPRIDGGQDIIQAIAEVYGTVPWIARLLCDLDQHQAQFLSKYPIARVVEWFAIVGPNNAPLPEEMWSFCGFMSEVQQITSLIRADFRTVEFPTRGSWMSAAEAIEQGTSSYDVRDFLQRFANDVILPELFQHAGRVGPRAVAAVHQRLAGKWSDTELGLFGAALFGAKQPMSVIRLVERMTHGGGHPMSLPGGPEAGALLRYLPAWPEIAPICEYDGLIVVPLTSAVEMVQEAWPWNIALAAMRCDARSDAVLRFQSEPAAASNCHRRFSTTICRRKFRSPITARTVTP